METTLAILMVIGIFGVFPLVVGFTVAGVYILGSRLNRRIQHAKDNKELTIETLMPVDVSQSNFKVEDSLFCKDLI